MQVKTSKRFLKDVEDLSTSIQETIYELVEFAELAEGIYDLPNLKKMKGYKNAYRIRLGTYRIGILQFDTNTIYFERCLHRKDIYKYFPK